MNRKKLSAKDSSQHTRLRFALSFAALVQMSHGGVTPALANIGESFANTSQIMLSLVNTIPVLTSIPASFLTGRLAGKRVRFRTLIFGGLVLLLAGGLLTVAANAMVTVLVCRAVFGVGLGIVITSVNSLTLCAFPQAEAQKQLALNSVTANLGSILFQLVGGYLCTANWRHTFLCYLIVLLPMAAAFLFVRPEDGRNSGQQDAVHSASHIPFRTLLCWCGVLFAFYVSFYVFVNNAASMIVLAGLGTSMDTAIVLSILNFGGMAGGVCYRRGLYRLERFAFLPALLLCIAGYSMAYFAESLFALSSAGVLFGFGFGLFLPAAMFYGGISVDTENRSKIVSYMTIANNLGGFCSAFMISGICSTLGLSGSRSAFLAAILIFAVLIVFFLFWAFRTSRTNRSTAR